MKHLLTSILLLSFCSSSFAQSSPPSGWSWTYNPSNGHYYALTSPGDWAAVQAEAISAEAHLVTINDQAENDWIVANINIGTGVDSGVWIGYQLENSAWEWVSGMNYSYENWDIGEPNGGMPKTNMWGYDPSTGRIEGAWNDYEAWRVLPGIIEWTDTLYVDGNGNGDYNDIQSAIDAAHNGNTVIVRDGIYDENINFNGKAITLKSENGAATTIIDGSGTGNVVTLNNGEDSGSVMDGFTVTDGATSGMLCDSSSPTLTNCTFTDNASPGMPCNGNSSPTLTDCTFTNNNSAWGGGGMYCHGSSSPTLTNCTFANNTTGVHGGGGMVAVSSSSPTLENCTFTGNTASYGGGICSIDTSHITLKNCTFTNNSANHGGGMYCEDSSSPTLSECVFEANYASVDGGAIYWNSTAQGLIEYCVIRNNVNDATSGSVGAGGGINIRPASNLKIYNCLITKNHSGLDGGGIFCTQAGLVEITNCTFADNTAYRDGAGVFSWDSTNIYRNCISIDSIDGHQGHASFQYSCLPGGSAGFNNSTCIDSDPLFTSTGSMQYFLSHVDAGQPVDSPCIDTGDPSIAPYGSTRVDGLPDLGVVDMGYHNL